MNLLEDDLFSYFIPEISLSDNQLLFPIYTPSEFIPEMPLPQKRERSNDSEDQDRDSKRSKPSSDSEPDTAATSAAAAAVAGGGQRRLWVKARSRDWWDRMDGAGCPESEFRRTFRMSRATFELLCEELGPAISKEDTTLRAAIPVRQRVAVCLFRLATGEPLRLVSKRFGLGISTCHKLVLEVCGAIYNVLMPKYLEWPENDGACRVFEEMSGIPNVAGAIYTTHIQIIAPKTNVAAYFNRRHTERNQKTSYSMTVQGVVDGSGIFTDICIGWPGSMSDEQVLESSVLYRRAESGELKNRWVVGRSGFPLMDWLMVPYTHKNLTWGQHAFNERVGVVSNVAKKAFERMKGRWGCLQKRTEMKIHDLPMVLGACCVLHNICEMRKEEMGDEVDFELVDDEMVADNGIRSASLMNVRDTIAHNLLHSGASW